MKYFHVTTDAQGKRTFYNADGTMLHPNEAAPLETAFAAEETANAPQPD